MSPEERLKQEILKNYKSVRAFTKEINVSYSTVDSMLKRGVAGAGVSTVLKVCKALGIEVESLIDNQNISPSFSFTQKEIRHIKKYRALDEHGQKMVDFTLTEEYNRLYPTRKRYLSQRRPPPVAPTLQFAFAGILWSQLIMMMISSSSAEPTMCQTAKSESLLWMVKLISKKPVGIV